MGQKIHPYIKSFFEGIQSSMILSSQGRYIRNDDSFEEDFKNLKNDSKTVSKDFSSQVGDYGRKNACYI